MTQLKMDMVLVRTTAPGGVEERRGEEMRGKRGAGKREERSEREERER